jgi:hypothetical protein
VRKRLVLAKSESQLTPSDEEQMRPGYKPEESRKASKHIRVKDKRTEDRQRECHRLSDHQAKQGAAEKGGLFLGELLAHN